MFKDKVKAIFYRLIVLVIISPLVISCDLNEKSESDAVINISSREDLALLDNHSEKSFKLINDINLDGEEWEPLEIFSGQLDGNNFTIGGLKITKQSSQIGFFKKISNALIKNLTFELVTIRNAKPTSFVTKTEINVGVIAAEATDDTVVIFENVRVVDSIVKIDDEPNYSYSVGGFVGMVERATVLFESCDNDAYVEGPNNTGGFVGKSDTASNVSFMLCRNFGTIYSNIISSSIFSSGGFVGSASGITLEVFESYNDGTIISKKYAGGIAGWCSVSTTKVNQFYNLGEVTGDGYTGGLFASLYSKGFIKNSFNLGTITSNDGSGAGIICSLSVYSPGDDFLIESCYNAGPVTARLRGGGIVSTPDDKLTIKNTICYGSIKGAWAGHLIGEENDEAIIINSFYSGLISGRYSTTVIGTRIALDKITKTFFLTTLNWDIILWDFLTTENSTTVYPILKFIYKFNE